eukprot:gene15527-6789_t
MCAYKLITVEFRYWGIQNKIEQYIQDSARRTVLVGHRQAWSWQDEWCSLTINDIREFEAEVQKDLCKSNFDEDQGHGHERRGSDERRRSLKVDLSLCVGSPKATRSDQSTEELILGIRMTSIEEDSEEGYETPESDDEYVDALDDLGDDFGRFAVRTPVEQLKNDKKECILTKELNYPAQSVDSSCDNFKHFQIPREMTENSLDASPKSVLLLVFHGGGVSDVESDQYPKARDFNTFKSVFSSVASLLYPSAEHNAALRMVECPPVCPQIVEHLRKISVFAEEKAPSSEHAWLPPTFPLSCIPLLLVSSLEFYQGVDFVINEANAIYRKFLETSNEDEENIKVSILADCVGALLVYGALCSQRNQIADNCLDSLLGSNAADNLSDKVNIEPNQERSFTYQRSSSIDSGPSSQVSFFRSQKQFEFDVKNFFCCGSPIGMILMKQFLESNGALPTKPVCNQVFNLFLPFDPCASRLEPLIDPMFSNVEPAHLPRYQVFPFSAEILYETHPMETKSQQDGEISQSPETPTETMFGTKNRDGCKLSLTGSCNSVDTFYESQSRFLNSGTWWGTKRIDYMLYCPDGLQQFPFSALSQLCYSSYWESRDMVAFILWQILDEGLAAKSESILFETALFQPVNPREKWIKKRTALKIKNMHSNHRANDVISLAGVAIYVSGKFVYGPIEVAALTGEK